MKLKDLEITEKFLIQVLLPAILKCAGLITVNYCTKVKTSNDERVT